MLVNLTEILLSEGKTEELQIDLELQEFVCALGNYPVVSKKPARFTFENMGKGKAHVEGEVSLVLMMNCDRCLKEVKQPIEVSFTLEVTEPNQQQEDAEEEQDFMEGYHLNITDLVSSELLTNWPMKVLCREDCRGICRNCGQNLNIGECDCDTFVPDPRMSVIKDIFNANN